MKPSWRYQYLWGFAVLLTTFSIGYLFSNQLALTVLNNSPYEVPVVANVVTVGEFETAFVPLDDSSEPGFNGWYALEDVNGERKSELFQLGVEYDDVDSDGSRKVTDYAGVFSPFDEIGDQGYVEGSWAVIDSRKASFKTKAINGFVYSFSGIFFKDKTTGEDGEKLLRGTFKTFKKGKLVRKATGDFSYYEPQCWH